MKKGKILMRNIRAVNPYMIDMPVGGHHITIYSAINNAFLREKEVFEGSVSEMIQLGVEAGLKESDLRQGFKDLVEFGFITVDGDTFTPTETYLGYMIQ